jgi:hypothetical protein
LIYFRLFPLCLLPLSHGVCVGVDISVDVDVGFDVGGIWDLLNTKHGSRQDGGRTAAGATRGIRNRSKRGEGRFSILKVKSNE